MSELIVEPIEKYGLSKKALSKKLFSRIGVIGCGKEGQNIARIAAFNGIEVVFIELSEDKIQNGIALISRELDRRIESWGLTQSEKKTIMGRISGSQDYKDLAECDFVIEAIRADERTGERSIDARKTIFKKVEEVVSPSCIIATNATTVVITELSSNLLHKDRCISLHFYVTSPEARLIEVVKGYYTTAAVYEKVELFVKLINREVIPVEESAGLVSVRLFVTFLNEACDILMEGVASKEDINKTTKIGFGHRYGIFHAADIIGLEKIEKWGENLFAEFGSEHYKPATLIKRLVRAKKTGVSCGQGFFSYNEDDVRISE